MTVRGMLPAYRSRNALRTFFLPHHPRRPAAYTHKPRLQLRTMASVNLATERFYADRDTPVCSLNVAKSFAQLRCVLAIIFTAVKSPNPTTRRQLEREEVRPLHRSGIVGRCADHPRADDTAGTQAL